MKEVFSVHKLPELGVGITYSSGIEVLLERYPDICDVLEIEPQTSWMEKELGSGITRISDPVLEHIARLPYKKLVHSVGMPVGTSLKPDHLQLDLIDKTIKTLGSPWMSEHLSFNNGHGFFTGFFLPPRQIEKGVVSAINNIKEIQNRVNVPIAIETGVNYLRPRRDEIEDGNFIAKITEGANCGILLDLHNIWTNHVNGRQNIYEFLEQIPLDRVCEIHLAGGMEYEGFWLDAHSGEIPKLLVEISREVIPKLPNLKAIIFEIFPSFIPIVGLDLIRDQILLIRDLWNSRLIEKKENEYKSPVFPSSIPNLNSIATENSLSIEEWEKQLGHLVTGISENIDFDKDLKEDPGIPLVKDLIKEFRASMVVSVLKMSSRFLMLALGSEIFKTFLEDFWSKNKPSPFASTEAHKFGTYLKGINLKIPNFNNLLEFELALVATLIDEEPRVVKFDRDPIPLFKSLTEGKLPETDLTPGAYEVVVTPNGPLENEQLSIQEINEFFPTH